jgi:hypothetical protein
MDPFSLFPWGVPKVCSSVNSVLFYQDLRLCSVSVRHEIVNCQKRWLEELAGLGKNEPCE